MICCEKTVAEFIGFAYSVNLFRVLSICHTFCKAIDIRYHKTVAQQKIILEPGKYYSRNLYNMLEKAMATHSSTLAWRIPWMEEPARLQSTGSLRVGHD